MGTRRGARAGLGFVSHGLAAVATVQQIYSVGHSSLSIEAFVALLERHGIEVVADVRSRPYSARFPHFSQGPIQTSLKSAGIRYVFLGRELGARREEPGCYVDGQATYDRIAKLPVFAAGIERLVTGAKKYRVALMCAEQDPLTCHRTILVGRELKKHGVEIQHIRRSGDLESGQQAEQRLIAEEIGSVDQADIFAKANSLSGSLEQAYARRASSIAYKAE
jgi:uncharacterized protein (DUF488 family)